MCYGERPGGMMDALELHPDDLELIQSLRKRLGRQMARGEDSLAAETEDSIGAVLACALETAASERAKAHELARLNAFLGGGEAPINWVVTWMEGRLAYSPLDMVGAVLQQIRARRDGLEPPAAGWALNIGSIPLDMPFELAYRSTIALQRQGLGFLDGRVPDGPREQFTLVAEQIDAMLNGAEPPPHGWWIGLAAFPRERLPVLRAYYETELAFRRIADALAVAVATGNEREIARLRAAMATANRDVMAARGALITVRFEGVR